MRALFTSLMWFFALLALPAFAQDTSAPPPDTEVRGTYGDWQIRCETGPNKNSQCFLTQSVMAKDQSNVGLLVIAGPLGDQKIEVLRVVAPLGVFLPMGVVIRIDDQPIGAMVYMRCTPDACLAETQMSNNDLLRKLKAGKSTSFVIFRTPDEGISIPISLNGFAQGYEQLKKK